MVNLPLVFALLTSWRLHADGVDVDATVVRTWDEGSAADPEPWVSFRLPARVDPDQQVQAAPVSAQAQAQARRAGTIPVRVLPDQPASFRVDGQVPSRLGLWVTLFWDLVLAGLAWWTWRAGRRDEAGSVLRLEATADVQAAPEGGADPEADAASVADDTGEVVVRGVVVESSAHEVVLDVGDGHVVVILDGRVNPVPLDEVALARGRPLPD